MNVARSLLVSLALVATSVSAGAQTAPPVAAGKAAAPPLPPPDDSGATAQFNRGMTLMDAGRYQEACEAFRQSEVPEPTMATQYQLGRCNEQLGHYATASGHYNHAADIATQKGDSKRSMVARVRAAETQAKAGNIVIVIPPELQSVEALTVTLDGKAIPRPQWAQAHLVDAGEHSLRIAAPGRQSVELNATVTATATVQVQIPILVVLGPQPAPAGDTPLPATEQPDDGEAAPPRRNKALFWTGLGLTIGGGLAFVGGIATAVTAEYDEDEELGIGLAVVGAAMAGTGIPFMVIFGKRQQPEDESAPAPEPADVKVEALVGPAYGGLRVTF